MTPGLVFLFLDGFRFSFRFRFRFGFLTSIRSAMLARLLFPFHTGSRTASLTVGSGVFVSPGGGGPSPAGLVVRDGRSRLGADVAPSTS